MTRQLNLLWAHLLVLCAHAHAQVDTACFALCCTSSWEQQPAASAADVLRDAHRHLFDGYALLVSFSIEDGRVRVTQRYIPCTMWGFAPAYGCLPAMLPAICLHGRYVESNAWKGLRDTGRMQFAEFATPLPLLQGVGRLLAGITGLGQGALPLAL